MLAAVGPRIVLVVAALHGPVWVGGGPPHTRGAEHDPGGGAGHSGAGGRPAGRGLLRVLRPGWALMLLLSLAGCAGAGGTWYAPGGHSRQDVNRDWYECRRAATVGVEPPGPPVYIGGIPVPSYPGGDPIIDYETRNACLRSRGWEYRVP